ncbi:hypothetical protein [Pseudomonas sp. Teo4]|uniref:hypothetical protein n=1 Tax=Pseudomonas sp. Teo4 TaxID=3064528 RepID=UPI002ABC6E02|nr:hypothetical protein [Pseudomonas sp. Teo4]MDZ3993112.1 hypothetical protein [Pseudomonas sp. Teo4]
MFGNVLTYDVYHLALYLLAVMAWSALGLWILLRGTGSWARYGGFALLGLTLTICSVMLVLDILRVLEHRQVEWGLLIFGMFLPATIMLTIKAGSIVSRFDLKRL